MNGIKENIKRHVQHLFNRIPNEKDKIQLCYNIARLFYKVRDYESAKHYLSLYMSLREESPKAYKLLGQIWEALGNKVQALHSYKTSLESDDTKQPELLLKLCKLLCETEVPMDVEGAQLWCERASNVFPHDPIVFRLKEKLLKIGGSSNKPEHEDLIIYIYSSEVKSSPDNVSARIRLMNIYLQTGRANIALSHAAELETNEAFQKNLAWYECISSVHAKFAAEMPGLVNWETYCTWVSAVDRECTLSLMESCNKGCSTCIQSVFRFDQLLYKAANFDPPEDHSEFYKQFIKHMSAQLCFHIATLIFKRLNVEPFGTKETSSFVPPVLFMAQIPPINNQAPWAQVLSANFKYRLAQWINHALYRVSQADYILLTLARYPKVKDKREAKVKDNSINNNSGNDKTLIEKVRFMLAAPNFRENVFEHLFERLESQRTKINTSQFVRSELLVKTVPRLPVHDSGFLRTQQLGAGKAVFGGQNKEESANDSRAEDGEADSSHDPELQPIVPLPDTIELRTREEDEDICAVFGGQNKEESANDSRGEDGEADSSHDPELQPIVPLPDTIELRTREEDEDISNGENITDMTLTPKSGKKEGLEK